MKRILSLIITIIALPALAQDDLPWDENGELTFTEVVPQEGADQAELYTRARKWFSESYKSANDVLQMDDKEAGVLVGKANNQITITSQIGTPVPMTMHYTIKVLLKDGRYKYDVTDIKYEGSANQYNNYQAYVSYPSQWFTDEKLYKKNGKERALNASYKYATINSISNLIESLKKSMDTSDLAEVDKGDW